MQSLCDPRSADTGLSLKRTILMFVFCFCVTSNAQAPENVSTYDVSLTCMFSEDIGEKKQKFQIIDDRQENALQCQWRGREMYCQVGDGYIYDWNLSYNVTVTKLSSEEPESRTCSCSLVGHDDALYGKRCTVEVTVHDASKTLSIKKKYPESSHSQNSTTEPSKDSLLKPLQSQQEPLVITAVAFSAAAALLGILAVIRSIYKRRRTTKSGKSERETENSSNKTSETSPLQDNCSSTETA